MQLKIILQTCQIGIDGDMAIPINNLEKIIQSRTQRIANLAIIHTEVLEIVKISMEILKSENFQEKEVSNCNMGYTLHEI